MFVFAKKRVPNDCSQKVSQFIAVCVVPLHSWLGFPWSILIEYLHGCALERSMSVRRVPEKTFYKLLTQKKFPFNYKLAQSILRCR